MVGVDPFGSQGKFCGLSPSLAPRASLRLGSWQLTGSLGPGSQWEVLWLPVEGFGLGPQLLVGGSGPMYPVGRLRSLGFLWKACFLKLSGRQVRKEQFAFPGNGIT